MTETIMPPEMLANLKAGGFPLYVAVHSNEYDSLSLLRLLFPRSRIRMVRTPMARLSRSVPATSPRSGGSVAQERCLRRTRRSLLQLLVVFLSHVQTTYNDAGQGAMGGSD
jgi:1-acyl-sn-glycerol-3-phosphate acyltransferase